MEFFVAGVTARTAADLVGVHRNSAIRFFHRLREKIAVKQERRAEQLCGPVELDESHFGGARKGKRGRGAAGKVPVFGLLKRGGKVFTQMLDDVRGATPLPIIREKVAPGSIVYTDGFRVYDALDVSGFRHFRINTLEGLRGRAQPHIAIPLGNCAECIGCVESGESRCKRGTERKTQAKSSRKFVNNWGNRYKRHRELLEPGEAPHEEVQRDRQGELQPFPQGVRVEVQHGRVEGTAE